MLPRLHKDQSAAFAFTPAHLGAALLTSMAALNVAHEEIDR